MAQVLIRNLAQDVVSRLKWKAELHGHSLEQELRNILEAAAPLSKEEKLELMNRAQAMTPKGIKQTPSEDIIREYRDSR